MIAALLATALTAGAAEPGDPSAMLAMNTGIKPLGLPAGAGLGGGLRVGPVLGRVTPFLGGAATWARVTQPEWDEATVPSLWTAQLGARVAVARLEEAETFALAGATFSDGGSRSVWDTQGSRGGATRYRLLPGAFAGGGVDAWVSRQVSVGVEAGLGYGSVTLSQRYLDGGRAIDEESWPDNTGIFTWSSLAATVWLGGAK